MIKCLNCKKDTRDDDKYCRNCGTKIRKNSYYVILNILNFIFIIILIFIVLLFIASYFIG